MTSHHQNMDFKKQLNVPLPSNENWPAIQNCHWFWDILAKFMFNLPTGYYKNNYDPFIYQNSGFEKGSSIYQRGY